MQRDSDRNSFKGSSVGNYLLPTSCIYNINSFPSPLAGSSGQPSVIWSISRFVRNTSVWRDQIGLGDQAYGMERWEYLYKVALMFGCIKTFSWGYLYDCSRKRNVSQFALSTAERVSKVYFVFGFSWDGRNWNSENSSNSWVLSTSENRQCAVRTSEDESCFGDKGKGP